MCKVLWGCPITAGRVPRLYYNAYRYSYRPSTGIDDLRVARARELLGYLSVPRLY